MKIRCAQCGEELLGVVNRCWKCGKTFPIVSGDPRLPPVRRRAALASSALATAAAARRGGSPFTAEHTARIDAKHAAAPVVPATAPAPRPAYPRDAAAAGAALGALVLGLCSMILALRSSVAMGVAAAALITSLVGVAMGVWGLPSQRRAAATIGLVLCCLALAMSSFQTLFWAYTNAYGVSPFAEEEAFDLDRESNVELVR